ncbi:MAG: glycine--tRNA ligase, partial [Candidatus Aenigmatarchaeota archaeon]
VSDKTKAEVPENLSAEDFDNLLKKHGIKCPGCKSALGATRRFNMMIKVDIGATNAKECYLRPETCQSIFVDFPRLFKTIKRKLPLGVAQIGKSFRNEISPRNSLLRMREFTQAEAEIFFNPKNTEAKNYDDVKDYALNLKRIGEKKDFVKITVDEAVKKKIISNKLFAYNLAIMQQFFVACGLQADKLRLRELDEKERAFYAKESWDTEFSSSLGWVELVANNYRTDYDMGSHGKISGKDVAVFEDNEKIIPHVWEISMGVDRTFYCMLESAYREENGRVFLKLPPHLAPASASIFPLVDKDGLAEKSAEIFKTLKKDFDVELEIKDSIGKRYARADEVGIPLCITVDHQTLQDGTVTLRNRDDTKQIRVKAEKLQACIGKFLSGEKFENLE